MNYLKAFITSKIGQEISKGDDNYAYNLKDLNFAVSDGASTLFASNIFSRLLVDAFSINGEGLFSPDVSKKITSDWHQEVSQWVACQGNPWYLVNDLNDPKKWAGATFAGLKLFKGQDENIYWKSYCLGDAVLVFVPDEGKQPSLIYTTNLEDRNPKYSENIVFNNSPLLTSPFGLQQYWLKMWTSDSILLEKGTFLLMTDAIAEWFLASPVGTIADRFDKLIALNSQDDFLQFVNTERRVRLQNNFQPFHDDDVTLMIFHIDSIDSVIQGEDVKDYTDYDYRTQILIEDSKELQGRMKTVYDEKSTLKTEKGRLETENSTLKAEKGRLETENGMLKAEKGKLETENTTLKAKNNSSNLLNDVGGTKKTKKK